MDVMVIEMLSYALPCALDRDMAKMVEQSLEDSQIKLLLNKTVSNINAVLMNSLQNRLDLSQKLEKSLVGRLLARGQGHA
jgi:pyruvate/2-oxoglutarate dehydrogenase complex dihydrolipoamide dehydrogenase (E3) component